MTRRTHVGKIAIEKSMSLDGYITGPNPGPENPLGDGGEAVFGWMMAPQPEEPAADGARELSEEYQEEIGSHLDATGAVIMGKRMWEIIDSPNGWVAPDGTPFPWPVFVLTHEAREPETKGMTRFTYVTDGPERALAQAQAVAGDKHIGIAGGNVCQQFIAAGLVDEIVVHQVPVFLGGGVRLFDQVAGGTTLEVAGVKAGNGVTHLTYRPIRDQEVRAQGSGLAGRSTIAGGGKPMSTQEPTKTVNLNQYGDEALPWSGVIDALTTVY